MVTMQSDHPPRTFLYGQRLSWAQAPAEVAAWVAARLGSRVVRWSDRLGGMSTGMACVVTGDDGRSLFVKAVNGSENPFALQLLIREAELSVKLPALPGVPRVLDAGEVTVGEDVWWAVITPAVPGHAVRHPWRPSDLARVLHAWDRVAVVLSGTPWAFTSRPPPFFTAWSALAADHADPWQPLVTSWLDREARLIDVSSGSSHDPPVLSHLDLRADNIVLTDAPADQEVWFVDWAHPGLAACWVDLALLLADVVGSGADASTSGPIDVMDVWRRHRIGSQCDPELLICVVSGLAAALHRLARKPVDPQLPHRSRWAAAMSEQMAPFVRRHTTAVQ
jgi:hypothetical protein